MKKLALALGGGGARGLAHIGFLRVLEKENIPIARIAGCSMGAMVGGAYCLYQDADAVEKISFGFIENPLFKEFNFDDFASLDDGGNDWRSKAVFVMSRIKVGLSLFKTLAHPSIYGSEITDKIYADYPDHKIEQLPIPFWAISSDLKSGKEILLKKGSLRTAVRASSAIPGYFPPVKYRSYLLVDGGVSNLVPTTYFEPSPDELIVGVDVSPSLRNRMDLDSGVNIMQRVEVIRNAHLTSLKTKNADKVVQCKMGNLSWADFGKAHEIIHSGEKAARQLLPWLRKNL
jgi:NTE family protein